MERFGSFDGRQIAYAVEGDEPGASAVLLHHGFASTSEINWRRPGIVDSIVGSGRKVVLLDARGHGESDHPHEPSAYEDAAMARDVSALLDHLALEVIDMAGYSMGSFVTMTLAGRDSRLRSAFLGGVGAKQMRLRHPAEADVIAQALEESDRSKIEDERGRAFRNFADATRQDRLALAAIQRADRFFEAEAVESVRVPVVVVNGEADAMAGDPASLAALIKGARSVVVPGDHISAVTKPEFRQAITDWAAAQVPGERTSS